MDRKSANEALHQLGFKPQFVAAGMEGFVFDIGNAMLAKAAYALATSNAYSEDGEDGHFRWCVGILNDEETSTILS